MSEAPRTPAGPPTYARPSFGTGRGRLLRAQVLRVNPPPRGAVSEDSGVLPRINRFLDGPSARTSLGEFKHPHVFDIELVSPHACDAAGRYGHRLEPFGKIDRTEQHARG